MKEYLVDVPVSVQVWTRPECQRKQFEVIKKARPSILFLCSDGGRNEAEWEKIRQNRAMFDNEIDWDCTVYRFYEETNNGIYTMMEKTESFIWATVDRCIFLEDDILPSVSYFRYCAELLERYKDDTRIYLICGMNHLGKSPEVGSDYFFSRQGSIWGVACWRRIEEQCGTFDENPDLFAYGQDPYVMKLLQQRTKHNPTSWRRARAYAKQRYYEGHEADSEFWIEFSMYCQNQLQIVPKVNMISNIGCTADATHADALNLLPRGIRRVFNMETYEMEFPMKHARYVIPDIEYEKKRNRIMGYNRPVIATYRRLERLFYKVIRGDLKYIFQKLKEKRNVQR